MSELCRQRDGWRVGKGLRDRCNHRNLWALSQAFRGPLELPAAESHGIHGCLLASDCFPSGIAHISFSLLSDLPPQKHLFSLKSASGLPISSMSVCMLGWVFYFKPAGFFQGLKGSGPEQNPSRTPGSQFGSQLGRAEVLDSGSVECCLISCALTSTEAWGTPVSTRVPFLVSDHPIT